MVRVMHAARLVQEVKPFSHTSSPSAQLATDVRTDKSPGQQLTTSIRSKGGTYKTKASLSASPSLGCGLLSDPLRAFIRFFLH
jgi:hypothetical protein